MKFYILANIQQIWIKIGDILIKIRLYLNGYTAKRLTGEFPQKSWTKRGVNKQLKSCETLTQAQLTNGHAV